MKRRPLRFGFSTLGCPAAELEAIVALARRHRLPAIELRALAGSIDLVAQLRARFGEPARLAAWRQEHAGDLDFPVVDASFRLSDGDDEAFAALWELAPWAEALGGRWLRVFDGPAATEAEGLRRCAARAAAWSEFQSEQGCRVGLAVETHDSVLDAAGISRLLDAAPKLRVVWDAYHTWARGGEDPRVTWSDSASAIVHIHIKDGIRRSAAPEHPPYVPPGAGEFPGKPLLDGLVSGNFSGAVVLEWERLWHPGFAPLDEALLAAEAAWFSER